MHDEVLEILEESTPALVMNVDLIRVNPVRPFKDHAQAAEGCSSNDLFTLL